MAVVLTVAAEAGMWDGPGHSPFLTRPALILHVELSQADRVLPVMTGISLGRSPLFTAPSDPGIKASSSLFSQTSSLRGPVPSPLFQQAQPTSAPGIHSRFFAMGCREDPAVLDEDTPT